MVIKDPGPDILMGSGFCYSSATLNVTSFTLNPKISRDYMLYY